MDILISCVDTRAARFEIIRSPLFKIVPTGWTLATRLMAANLFWASRKTTGTAGPLIGCQQWRNCFRRSYNRAVKGGGKLDQQGGVKPDQRKC
jgi:heme A synthase